MQRILSIILAMVLPLAAGEFRMWTNPDGTKQFKAEYISHTNDTVTLRPVGGNPMTIALDKLHTNDHKWITENHPTKAQAAAADAPDDNCVFDTLKFGDSRKEVTDKLKESKMVEANLNSTFFGRTGINGIYRTVKEVGGIHCWLFFDWDEADKLNEITLRTEDKPLEEYETALKPCWQELIGLITFIHGKPLQTTPIPAAAQLQNEQMLASHLWRIENGGTVLLGTSKLGDSFQVNVRFTEEKIEVRRVP
jgi:hypothetical protein